jgi:ATP-dependent 26S proteasome regulatory subunit
MKTQIETYVRAGYPALFVITVEEQRAEAEIQVAAQSLQRGLHVWSATSGLVDTRTGQTRDAFDPLSALDAIEALEEKQLIILRDFALYVNDQDPLLLRKLREGIHRAKSQGKTLILLGCDHPLPREVQHDIIRLPFALPDSSQLAQVLEGILQSAEMKPLEAELSATALAAASGLTTIEAENAFALSLVETSAITPKVIAREKANALKQGGLLEVIDHPTSLESLGGLDALKKWLLQRREAFSERAREYGLPSPKGLLIVGVPGTGKSLTAKATASAFGLPLLKLDAGRLFGGIVGQSEANLRQVIQTAEAIAPCVLWIDELEKAFAGSKGSGSTDGGTSSRVFGAMLAWMQEKQKPVFVVATANDVSQLPPELLRKGRFDELFFVDLPNQQERTDIWDIVIGKYGRRPTDFDCVRLARGTSTFTGAEIDQCFVDALHRAFAENREVAEFDLGMTMVETVPLANLMDEDIARLRRWAEGRARHATHAQRAPNATRQLDL